MSKSTPGPWFEQENSDAITSKDREICVIHSFDSIDDANARLIAAAPQMLEALLDCRRALEIANFSQELQVVDAAIAKATGEA